MATDISRLSRFTTFSDYAVHEIDHPRRLVYQELSRASIPSPDICRFMRGEYKMLHLFSSILNFACSI